MTDVPLDLPVNALISFHYFGDVDVAQMQSWGLRMIGDCGAYSADSQGAPIDRDAFFEWGRRWRRNLLWVASLDVIGDPKASWANWRAAPADLRLVPTVHYGSEPSLIDRYVEAGADLIGLGGMVPFKSEPKRLLRWCLSVMRYARDNHPHVRFHGWGVTHPQLVMNLPWWSVDSSGFSSAYRYGRLSLFNPDTKKSVTVAMDGRSVANTATLLREHYGLEDWRRIAESTAATRRDLVRVSMRSMQLTERYLQHRHRVTPPPSLAGVTPGPQVHFVDATRKHLGMVGPNIHFVEASGSARDSRSLPESDPGAPSVLRQKESSI